MEYVILLVVIAAMFFFMYRSNKKRQREAQSLQSRTAVGAEVMTNFGLFGTVTAIDDAENIVSIETTPGTVVRVHRQTISRVIDPVETEPAAEEGSAVAEGEERTPAVDSDVPAEVESSETKDAEGSSAPAATEDGK